MAPLSSPDLSEEKRALRREMSAARAALPEAERHTRSEAASARLLALPELAALAAAGPRTVAGYVAVKGEIDPAPALATAAAGGAAVALPRDAPEAPRLRFHLDAGPLTRGRFGLEEPDASAPEIAVDELDVVIVPGLAFDAEGRRLGFGGGYYDGAFGELASADPGKRPALIGLCYDFQIVARCPAGDGDVPVDLVVTEARVLRRAEGKR
jgi:5-formyltetrahydrofolate cyclo-ligase